jgi:hypothetical protein
MYINDAPQTHGFHLALFETTPVCMLQIARRVLLLENSSAVSAQWRPSVSAGVSKLIRIRLGGSTSLVDIDCTSFTSH